MGNTDQREELPDEEDAFVVFPVGREPVGDETLCGGEGGHVDDEV
jgi:hypothetical protein